MLIVVNLQPPWIFLGGIFINNQGTKMTIDEIRDVFTVKTSYIPPEDIYYQRLGQMIREMRMHCNLTPMNIWDKVGITPSELHEYECGGRPIEIYTMLRLLSYLEYPSENSTTNKYRSYITGVLLTV